MLVSSSFFFSFLFFLFCFLLLFDKLVGNVQHWTLQHLLNAILVIKNVLFSGHFTKMCSTKFPPATMKASSKTACHKIQWLQFTIRNITRFQSWHSSKHFQIPIALAIWTLQFWFGTNYNFGVASIAICERGFKKKFKESLSEVCSLWSPSH